VLIVQPPANPVIVTPPAGGFYLGKNSATSSAVIASATELDRHLLIIGATGCGKTTLIERLFIEEVSRWQ
jgi:MoxR-like ATPase